MQGRDRLTRGTCFRACLPGVLPIVPLHEQLDPAIDALADALGVLLQISPDAYLQKEGLPAIHSEVALDPGKACAVCGRTLNSLRVLCATCRRAPTTFRRSHSYVQLCWQGSNPRLFSRELLETYAVAEKVDADAREAIQICLQTDGEAARLPAEQINFRLDDLRQLPHWHDADYFAGLAPLLAAEIYPFACEWVEEVDAGYGERSPWLQARLDNVAAQVAAHSAWDVELTEDRAVEQAYAEVRSGAEQWERAERWERPWEAGAGAGRGGRAEEGGGGD